MKISKCLLLAILIFGITIFLYVFHFHGISLSDDTSDLGAFCGYINIGISAISVALIFITYREQRQSNRIERFEQHLKSMVATITEQIAKNGLDIDEDFESLKAHFQHPFDDSSNYEREISKMVCGFYFSLIAGEIECKYLYLFKYMTRIINTINNEKSIERIEKEGRLTELSFVFPVSFRLTYFFWLVDQKEYALLELSFANRLFSSDKNDEKNLCEIVRLVCVGEKNTERVSIGLNDNELDIQDYSQEQFKKTYNRFVNNKKLTS